MNTPYRLLRALRHIKTPVLTNRCTMPQSVHSFYYSAATYFGIVAIFRELTPEFLHKHTTVKS